ncbi:MAG: DNA gyrase inhibitor YacG [Variovorax sp.]
MPSGTPSPSRRVRCPACGGNSVYAPSNPFRPFCSARCKGIDFGAWASEAFRLPADTPPDDKPFGDPKLQ